MAMTHLPTGQLTLTLEDASGSQSKMTLHVPWNSPAVTITTNAATLLPLIEAATDCVVVAQSLTYGYYDPEREQPAAGARVEEKGVIIFRAANGRPSQLTIPGIKDSLLNKSGSINRENADFTALAEAILSADAAWCAADGSDLVGVDKAYQAFRRSTKRQLPSDR